MQKMVNIISPSEEINKNFEYWQSRSESERISVVQELREQYIHLYNKEYEYNESRKKLRKFYRIVKQAPR